MELNCVREPRPHVNISLVMYLDIDIVILQIDVNGKKNVLVGVKGEVTYYRKEGGSGNSDWHIQKNFTPLSQCK